MKIIKIFGYVIEEEARNSFEKWQRIYRIKEGFYEIDNFYKPKEQIKGGLFGSSSTYVKPGSLFNTIKLKPNNNLFGNRFQSHVNSSFTNFVVKSVTKVNSSNNDIFNN